MIKPIANFLVYPVIILLILFIIISSNFQEIRSFYRDIRNIAEKYYNSKTDLTSYGDMAIFHQKKEEIRKELLIIRSITDADGVSVVMFHDINKKFRSETPFLITMLDEVTPPHLSPTTDIIQNVPSEYVLNPERKVMGFCIAYEVGSEDDNDFFKYLPPRILIGCPIYYNEKLVGLLIAVKNSQSTEIREFTSYIPLMGEKSNRITEIINEE